MVFSTLYRKIDVYLIKEMDHNCSYTCKIIINFLNGKLFGFDFIGDN